VLYPPWELQGLRTAATLVFLAYNAKTALMNFSTMLNTYAALTTEYGEMLGHKLFAKGLTHAAQIFTLPKNPKTQHIQSTATTPANSALAWMYNKAVSEGVIDQSYAYFLAGQANGNSSLLEVRRSKFGQMARMATEAGMYPFRMIEKMNRLATLTMFFEAERSRGSTLEAAYVAAVQRTNLLLNILRFIMQISKNTLHAASILISRYIFQEDLLFYRLSRSTTRTVIITHLLLLLKLRRVNTHLHKITVMLFTSTGKALLHKSVYNIS
jgi:hypothetical protein